ncbi:hypothetical protein HK099_002906 [Clydaea vesicula]|uniref:Uncharacterized protein n=1 Tax=Clydaea vesicula TaxID=447962 RepID=A0AAD5U8F4_9FUNG|nr:hypothetical protein HK099_002906 [Clydaea vesicula]
MAFHSKAVKENKSSPGIYWVKAAILLSSRSIKLSHGFSSNISPVFKKDVLLLERKIALLNQVNPVSESSFVEGYFSASTIDNTAIKIGERRICPSRCMNRPIRLLKNSVCSFTCNIQTISAKNKEFCKPIKEKKQKNLIAAKPSLNEATCPVNGTFGVNSTSFTPTVMFNVSPGTKTTEYSLFNLHYNCLKFLYSLFSQFKIFEGLVNDNLSYSISEESVKKIGFKEIFLWQHHITGPVTEANQVADHFINHSIKHFIPLTTGNFKRRFIEPTPTQKSTKAIPTNFTDDIFAANYAKAVPTIFKFGKLIDDDHQVKSTSAQHSWRLEATPTVFKVYNVEATPVVFKVRKFEATPTVLNVQKVEATRTVFKVQKVEATSAVFKDYKIVTTSVKMNSAVYSRTKPTVFNVVSVSQVEPTATRGYIHVYPGSRPTAIKYKVNDYVNLPGDNNLESTSYFPSGKNAICSKSSIEVKKIAGNFFNSRFTSRQPYFTSQWDFLKSTNLSEGMENYIQAKQIKSGSKTIKNLYNIASNAFMPSFFVHNLIHLGVNVTNPSEVVVGPKFGIKNVVVDSKFIDTKCVNEFTLRSALVSDDIDFFSNAGKEIETHRRNRFNNGRLLEKKSLGIYDALSLPSDEYDTERHCKNRICEDDKKKPDSYNITFPNLESLKYCYTAEKKINILKYFEDSLVFRANFKENLRKFIGHQGNIVTTNKFSRNDSNGGSFKIYNINVESAIFEKLLVVTKLWIKEFALIFAAIAGWKHLIDEILKGFEKFNLKWGAIEHHINSFTANLNELIIIYEFVFRLYLIVPKRQCVRPSSTIKPYTNF